jgi:hypothetical protein
MAKLHELLAVEKDRSGVANKVMEEAKGVFKAGAHYFGHVKATTFFEDPTSQLGRTEVKIVDDTVPSKLDYVGNVLRRLLDLMYQIDLSNTEAKADLVVNGVTFAEGVPAGFLMILERKLTDVRGVYEMIPTHPPGIDWQADPTQRLPNVAKSVPPIVTFLTQKKIDFAVPVAATEHHPAQIKEVTKDERVARVEETKYTGTISAADKSEMLRRLDMVIAGTKRARQRANGAVASDKKIARKLLAFINTGATP